MKNNDYPPIIRTDRLVLRQWNSTDLEPFAALNADQRVMEYFPSVLSQKESNDLAKRISIQLEEQGWGLWAVSVPEVANFIGFIGLARPSFDAYFTPAVEVGWRLDFNYWGKGYATEGAKAVLAFGFDTLNLEEIVSFTVMQNERSRRIMEKIGMYHVSKDDFDHSTLSEDHGLYHINQQEWRHQTHIKRKYLFKPYSKIFPDLFQKEKERIAPSLTNVLAIEHIGSTAIPGLGGKGIIDIAISIPKEEMEHASNSLKKLGYEFRPTYSNPDRFYFITYLADPEEGSRRYHIHLTYPENKEWKELIGFKDYLKTHPEAIEEYATIKKQAARLANQDGEQYRKMKEPIIQKIKAFI
ncbi:MAG: GNAT family N-acetyltransferase [Parachlamydia sp.]|jgi:3-dehydroquinate dehydratase/shikimate dehydrogenase|nr:GNAT family N-acetyltransferase [Parachlamydia sp.]